MSELHPHSPAHAGVPPLRHAAPRRPVQTLLASFSGAYFVAVLLTDFAYVKTANMMWANFSSWLLVAGLVFGGFGALAALVNAFRERAGARRPAWIFFLGLALVFVLSLVNAFVHSRDAWTSVVPTGIALSAVVAVILFVLGWIGWTNATRHRAGGL